MIAIAIISKIIKNKPTNEKKRILLIISAILLGALLLYFFWYVVLPICAIVFIWWKTHLGRRKKWYATAGSVMAMIILTSIMYYSHRPPTITIKEPQNNITVQTETITITGSITPQNASLKINNEKIKTDNGNFAYPVNLAVGKNEIKINAKTWYEGRVNLTVTRELTEAEKEAINQAEAKAEAERIKVEARARAEQAAWEASPAGQICSQHTSWTKDDCTKLANRRVWVGMNYDMLIYLRGKPNHINVSNYGRGNEYQYCWDDRTPSCFYDNNSDDIIDAYN